jgi:hypothetical protein
MDIYSILSSKTHNPHHLKRYITFIQKCQRQNVGLDTYMERHHICPKAKDMFPEYSSFRENPWNFVCLTPRQHFIAHLILWKCFYDYKSQLIAINLMKRNSEVKNSRIYHKMRCDYKKMIVEVSKDQAFHLRGNNNPCHERIKDGTHIFLFPEFRKKEQRQNEKE